MRDQEQRLEFGILSLNFERYTLNFKHYISDCIRWQVPVYLAPMSIRKRGGEWEPLVLGVEPESCGVCGEGLYRNVTLLRGGWSRCSVCQQFVHYSCLASGKISFLKRRPRVCKSCESPPTSSEEPSHQNSMPSAVTS